MRTVRTFIGVHLSYEVKRALVDVSRDLGRQLPQRSIRWVQGDRMHLTMRFLGETAVSKLPQIATGLDQVCANYAAMTLQLSELGCFPNRRRPRVLWAGLAGELARLQSFKKEMDKMLAKLGWPVEERPFHPHLTLGRVKDARQVAAVDWAGEVEPLAVPVTAVHLIESRLKPSGPEYIVRHSSNLRQN